MNGDPRDGMEFAVNRPEGFDPAEACTSREAFIAYTATSAWINGDSGSMGSLEPGMLADFQLLD